MIEINIQTEQKEFAIVGGTFDQIHLGHLHLIKEVANKFDKVLVIPSGKPWLKQHTPIASAQQRFQMADLAITSMGLSGKVEVLPLEVNRDGDSYTLDTVNELSIKYSNTNFTLVLGSDAAKSIGQWHKSAELLQKVKVLVISRPGSQPSDFDEVNIKALDISSTKVRKSILERKNVSNLLPAKVVTFIREYGLYGSR